MGEISVWVKGCQKNIGGVTHRTTAAEIVRFTLTDCVWRTTEKARRPGRCYALFENWRGCQRLIPPCKRIYKLWKLWGLERIHVKFVVKKVAMETLARKDFGEYVEASQLKVPKRHVALRTQPHVLDSDESDQTSSSDGVGLFIIAESDSEEGHSPNSRRKRMLLKHVLRQNDQLHTLSKTVEDVDEEILFYEAKLHHFRVVEDGDDYVQHAYLNGKEASTIYFKTHQQVSSLDPEVCKTGSDAHAPTLNTPDQSKGHEHCTTEEGLTECLVKGNSARSNVQDANQSEVKSRMKKDFSPKSSTKVVVVNPLPRNEGSSSEQKQTERETLKETDNKSAITRAAEGLLVPRIKLPLSKTKRRMKNGIRSKRKKPGLYEFEQSCEWLKVMDKELKRLESMENLSFVDWDSESLLSEKQLTFASGNRKFRFRSGVSGKEFKKYDLNENVAKVSEVTELSREFSNLHTEETPVNFAKSTSSSSQIEENENLSEGAISNNECKQSLRNSDNFGNRNSQSENGLNGKIGWEDGNSVLSSTKPATANHTAVVNRPEEIEEDNRLTDCLKVGDGKTDGHTTLHRKYTSISVDDSNEKNNFQGVRSTIRNDKGMTPHEAFPLPREGRRGYDRNLGNFRSRDLRPKNDSKKHEFTSKKENIGQVKESKFGSDKKDRSSLELGVTYSKSVPMSSNIGTSKSRTVLRDTVTVQSSNAFEDPQNSSDMKDRSEDSTKVLGPALEPQSSPVSVRRVPKPPMYYPTEASGPVLHVPCEGPSVPRRPGRDTFFKQHNKNCSGSQVAQGAKDSVVSAVHPRVEQLRTTGLHTGTVGVKTSDLKRNSTSLAEVVSPDLNSDKSNTSVTVGLAVGTFKTNVETLESSVNDIKNSTSILPPAATDLPVCRSGMKSPDQGLGSELFSPEEKSKLQENDSSSDTGMSSLLSQDSGISNASVVLETWV